MKKSSAYAKTLSATFLLLMVGSCISTQAQQISVSTKGKNGPPVLCSAPIVGFDGTNLSLVASSGPRAIGSSSACPIQTLPISQFQIYIVFGLGALPLEGYVGGYQNQQAPHRASNGDGSAAYSVHNTTKDTDLQQAEQQESRHAQAQRDNGGTSVQASPPAVDLSHCHARGSDWIETSDSGLPARISGKITSISGNVISLIRAGQTNAQTFELSKLTALGLGFCTP